MALPDTRRRVSDPDRRRGESGRARDRSSQPAPSDDQEQVEPGGGDRPRADDRARAGALGGLVLGAFAYLVAPTRSSSTSTQVSRSGEPTTRAGLGTGLGWITHLGDTLLVVALAILLAVVEYIHRPSRWIAPFLLVVILGQNADERNQGASRSSPADPEPHRGDARPILPERTFGNGRGLLRGGRARDRTRTRLVHTRLLAGGAVAIAVAVACTRVLLDFHWLSDVIAGLALGWAWFAVCSIAFGGRMLKFGAAAEKAVQAADAESRRTAAGRRPELMAGHARPGKPDSRDGEPSMPANVIPRVDITGERLLKPSSLLDFHSRVLELAADVAIPLLERVKFCAISLPTSTSSSRFASPACSARRSPGSAFTRPTGSRRRRRSCRFASVCSISPHVSRESGSVSSAALAAQGIMVGGIKDCRKKDLNELEGRFEREIYPVLTPLAVGPGQPFPYISALSLSLAVFVADPETGEERFARVEFPEAVSPLPGCRSRRPLRSARAGDRPLSTAALPGVSPLSSGRSFV